MLIIYKNNFFYNKFPQKYIYFDYSFIIFSFFPKKELKSESIVDHMSFVAFSLLLVFWIICHIYSGCSK